MESCGSVADVRFVELLHGIEVAELFFVVQNLWGDLKLYLVSFRETFCVDSLFSGRGWLHCCLFILVFVNVLSVELLSLVCI
jgi:hypothetical protein